MKQQDKDEQSVKQTIELALQKSMSHGIDDDWSDVDPELLLLLVEGRSHDIHPEDRARLLKRIAVDPGLGNLLKTLKIDFHDVIPSPMLTRTRLAMRIACAACIVALVLVGTFILGDTSLDNTSVEVLDSGSTSPDFLDQLGSTGPSSLSRLAGDPVFVTLFILAVMLGCGSFLPRKKTKT